MCLVLTPHAASRCFIAAVGASATWPFSTVCERPCRRCPAAFTRGLRTSRVGLQLGDLLLCPLLLLLFLRHLPAFSSSDSYTGDHTSRRWSGSVCIVLPYTCCRIFAGATVCFSFNTLHLPGGRPEPMEVHNQSGPFTATLLGQTSSLSSR